MTSCIAHVRTSHLPASEQLDLESAAEETTVLSTESSSQDFSSSQRSAIWKFWMHRQIHYFAVISQGGAHSAIHRRYR